MLGFIITMLVIGTIAGFLGRLLVPGPDPMSVPVTILVGIIGSFVGGFIGWALFGKDLDEGALQPSGIIGSVAGAVLVVLAYRAMARRGVSRRDDTLVRHRIAAPESARVALQAFRGPVSQEATSSAALASRSSARWSSATSYAACATSPGVSWAQSASASTADAWLVAPAASA
jgi:uncharacterized membrane protein YeaQ/YmgE (transglycosylase-associated protein family)